MSTDRKPPERHPSTAIPTETVEEIAYRIYLARLEPPMTPEISRATRRVNDDTGRTIDDSTRRRNSRCMLPLVRDTLRILVDLEMVTPPPARGNFW